MHVRKSQIFQTNKISFEKIFLSRKNISVYSVLTQPLFCKTLKIFRKILKIFRKILKIFCKIFCKFCKGFWKIVIALIIWRNIFQNITNTEPCQISKMKHVTKIVNRSQPLTIFVKRSILDVCQGSEYTSVRESKLPGNKQQCISFLLFVTAIL